MAALTTADGMKTPALRVTGLSDDVKTPVADVCTVIPNSTGEAEFAVVTYVNNADVVAEGGPKPETTYTVDVVSERLDNIATWTEVTRQFAEDNQRVMDKVQSGRAVLTKAEVEVASAIAGGTYSVGGTNSDTAKAAAQAIGVLLAAGYSPNAVMMNPVDFAYFASGWAFDDVALVANPFLSAGSALVGDFKIGVEVHRSPNVGIHVTDSHASNFTQTNVLTILQELRNKAMVVDSAAIVKTAAV